MIDPIPASTPTHTNDGSRVVYEEILPQLEQLGVVPPGSAAAAQARLSSLPPDDGLEPDVDSESDADFEGDDGVSPLAFHAKPALPPASFSYGKTTSATLPQSYMPGHSCSDGHKL
jgi:hypothetical protein